MTIDLDQHQRALLELLVTREALRFGEFTLKSGRTSPYFINTGCFCAGGDLAPIGQAYAAAIAAQHPDVDIIFGPAYKGIPLALATAQALEAKLGRTIDWCYDRKEAKTHGDGGSFVGAKLIDQRKVVVVDDVITAGTALRESLTKMAAQDVQVLGAIVSVDREETGARGQLATTEIAEDHNLPVTSILSISQVVDYLAENDIAGKQILDGPAITRIRKHLAGTVS